MREVIGGPVQPSPDTTAPVTSATCAPGPCGSWQKGQVQLTLAATDAASGVTAVRYTTNGSDPTASSALYTRPLTIKSTTTVRFRAWDSAANVEPVQSAAVRIDPTSPLVVLTSPSADASILAGTPVTLSAAASDTPSGAQGSSSGVASVTFRAGGALVAVDPLAPFQATWTPGTADRGRVTLTATATDAAGNVATSSVTVRVR
jgi:hypothetical protein